MGLPPHVHIHLPFKPCKLNQGCGKQEFSLHDCFTQLSAQTFGGIPESRPENQPTPTHPTNPGQPASLYPLAALVLVRPHVRTPPPPAHGRCHARRLRRPLTGQRLVGRALRDRKPKQFSGHSIFLLVEFEGELLPRTGKKGTTGQQRVCRAFSARTPQWLANNPKTAIGRSFHRPFASH